MVKLMQAECDSWERFGESLIRVLSLQEKIPSSFSRDEIITKG